MERVVDRMNIESELEEARLKLSKELGSKLLREKYNKQVSGTLFSVCRM